MRSGAVIQVFRRSDRFQPQIDIERVALIGSNVRAVGIEGVALLVVLGDDVVSVGAGQRPTALFHLHQQLIDVGPAPRVKRQADLLRLAPQH
jgi:hypothetical protein